MKLTIGLDEVGRGCWAGPLVAAAVLLAAPIDGLNDSKLLSAKRREQLSSVITEQALAYGVGWVSAKEVDELGLTKAVGLAMQKAISQLNTDKYDEIIIDGNINYLPDMPRSKAVIKADGSVASVSAASIIAKVARDKYMYNLALEFPGYGFDKHVGYGTKQHLLALKQLGICREHRLSYKPIKAIIG